MSHPCQICGGQDFTLWRKHKDIPIVLCDGCGLGRAEMPEASADMTHEVYDESYHLPTQSPETFQKLVRRGYLWVSFLTELHAPGTLLDIGCARGYYMQAAKSLGWNAWGTDLAPHAVEDVKQRGFPAFIAEHPSQYPADLPPLDGVIMAHIIEHFPDPFDYMSALRERMAPGGVAYIELPDFVYFQRHSPEGRPFHGPPEHLWFFNKSTARRMLEKTGWEIVRQPRFRRRLLGSRPGLWASELFFNLPRELVRPVAAASGWSKALHIFARVR